MMTDIMLDLETMDNTATSAILSVGAVACNLVTGEIYDTYYRVVDLQYQQENGFTFNPSTIYWWLGQTQGARRALTIPGKILLEEMCKSFDKWIRHQEGNSQSFRLWGNGASFDNAIIRHAFSRFEKEFPIPFWQDRDVRTVVGFYPYKLFREWKLDNQREGTYHNALDDAKYQVAYCSHILQELGVEELH